MKSASSCSHGCCGSSSPSIASPKRFTPKFRKSLQNSPESPWFDWICDGRKRYEGRLRKDVWASLAVGDIIAFVCPLNRELICRVVSLPHFESFGAAFDKLGSALVPIPGINTADIDKLYSQYFNDEDVRKYGVVAIEIEPLHLN